jgi:hypothetical protein
MERSHAQITRIVRRYEFGNTFLHLTGGFVGKGKSHNTVRWNTLLQQVSNTIRQNTRLSGTGTGYY